MDCLFCKFINKELKTDIVYEDENILAFKDISPLAKTHILFIPKTHSNNISEMVAQGEDMNNIFKAITSYAKEAGLEQEGYRVVNNLGTFGGQSVFHTHFHLLGAEQLKGFGA